MNVVVKLNAFGVSAAGGPPQDRVIDKSWPMSFYYSITLPGEAPPFLSTPSFCRFLTLRQTVGGKLSFMAEPSPWVRVACRAIFMVVTSAEVNVSRYGI